MKTLTVAVTDEAAKLIEDEGRRRGISSEALVLHVVDEFFSSSTILEKPIETATETRPKLWYIGTKNSGGPISNVSANFDAVLADSLERYLLEDEVSYIANSNDHDHEEEVCSPQCESMDLLD